MRLDQIADSTLDALRQAGAFAGGMVRPSIRLGVTGLSRAGKTVFITALVHNLVAGGRLPFLRALAEGRLHRAYLQPQPDDTVPRFEIERHLDALCASPPVWPESTRRISELRVRIEYEPRGLWHYLTGTRSLDLDIVDYPGEWLSDLPLLAMSYADWSREALALSRQPALQAHARHWHGFLATLDPAAAGEEAVAITGAELFRAYLLSARAAGAAAGLSPGRFLTPGELEGSPALTFMPLDLQSGATPHGGSLAAMLERRYASYCRKVVLPFFRDHFSRLDRQIVLVDVLSALAGGTQALEDLGMTLEGILRAFRTGSNTLFTHVFAKRIERILFAATKADQLHQSSHDRLEAVLGRITRGAIERARFADADVKVGVLAAVRATSEARITVAGETLPCIRGVPMPGETIDGKTFDGFKEAAVFPGDLPADPEEALARASGTTGFSLVRFRPPKLQAGTAGLRPPYPHIRLDRALEFLIGDRLL